MVKELNHVGLRMVDLEQGLRLYRDALGGKVILDAWALDGKGHIIYVQMGNTIIELILTQDPTAQGFAHLAFLLKGQDLDNAYAKIAKQGYFFSIPPKPAGTGNGRLAFFDNGAELVLELIERTEDIRLEPFSSNLFTKIDHIAVAVPRERQADTGRIFVEELGFTRESDVRFSLGDDAVEMILPTSQTHPVDSLVFHTTNASAVIACLSDEGLAPQQTAPAQIDVLGHAGEKLVFQMV